MAFSEIWRTGDYILAISNYKQFFTIVQFTLRASTTLVGFSIVDGAEPQPYELFQSEACVIAASFFSISFVFRK